MKMYYDFDAIYNAGKKADCRNLLIAGGKGNGKTFGALRKGLKIYLGLENEESKGRVIRYARRLKETVRRDVLLNLFKPHEKWIEAVTNGAYNTVRMYGRRFYLAYVNPDNKVIRRDKNECCICNALSTWETDCGPDEGEAGIIIFDEAISRERELRNEFDSLMRYHNNCTRNRMDYYCPLVLIGNTVTRDCTIFENFGIDLWKIDDAEKGHIQYVKNRAGKINCIFEWCGTAGIQEKSREYYERFENDKTKMITDGVFSLGEYKTMSEARAELDAEPIIKICFIHPHFPLFLRIMQYKKSGDVFAYITNPDHVPDDCDLKISPIARTCNGILRNYFDCGAADLFRYLYDSGNVLFDAPATGEKYRTFASECRGLESCIPD